MRVGSMGQGAWEQGAESSSNLLVYKCLHIDATHFVLVWNDVDFCVRPFTRDCYRQVLKYKYSYL